MKPENFHESQKKTIVSNISLIENSTIDFPSNLLEELANATWGCSWPDGSKKYIIDRDGWNWYARNVHNSRQHFLVCLNFDHQRMPMFFTIFHSGGSTKTRDITESELRIALHVAYKAGPA